jgi:hypothetical protein
MAQNFLSDIKLGDSIYIRLGDGTNGDLRLYHNATHSYIDGANTGDLYIRSLSDDVVIQGADDVFIYTQGGEDAIIARGDAGVELFYNNSKKIETTNVGATITGALSITGGIITLGVADTSSGHINAYENMTFNIDTDDDDTNRYFAWYTNSSDGGGTELLKILETGNATFAGTITVGGDITATGADFTLAHAAGATIFLRRDDTSISDGNVLGLINFQGDDPTDDTFNTGVALMGKAAGDWASGSYESEFILQTRNTSGGLVTALTVNEAQNTTFAGNIRTTEDIGRDDHNRIMFSTDDSIIYRVADTHRFRMDSDNFSPYADSSYDLGTSSLYFRAAYIDAITTTGNVTVGGNITVSSSTNRSIILDYTGGSGTYTWASFKQSGTEQFRIWGDYTSNYLSFYNDQASVHQLKLNSDGSTTFAGKVSTNGASTDFHANASNLVVGSGSGNQGITIFSGSSAGNYGSIYFADGRADGAEEYRGMITYEQNNEVMRFHTNTTEALKLDLNQNATFAGDVTIGDDMFVADGGIINVGTGNDLNIQHDGTDSIINNNTGHLYITNYADDKDIYFRNDDGSGGVATYFYLDGSASLTQFDRSTKHVDDVRADFGSSSDLRIHHDGTDSYIRNTTGALYIQSEVTDGNIVFNNDDGTGGGQISYFSVDGGSATHDGSETTAMYTKWYDKSRIALGSGKDLQLYHDGSNSYIRDTGTGSLFIQGDNIYFRKDDFVDYMASFIADGAVNLYFNNSKKFETTNTGVTVTGEEIVFKGSSPEFYFHTTGNHVNWLMAAQESTNACLEFSAVAASTSLSTTAGDYTPVLKLFQSSAATFAGTIASGNITVTGSGGGNGQVDITRTSGASIRLQSQSALAKFGTTTDHGVQFMTNDTGRWNIQDDGDIVPVASTYDIGSSGGHKPANVYATNFHGDGSNLTGVTSEWDGSLTGNASITGELTINNAANNNNLGIHIKNDNNLYSGALTFWTEYSGTDTHAARIQAGTDGTDAALYLQVANTSKTLTSVLTLDHDLKATFAGTISAGAGINVTGNIDTPELSINDYVKHNGDTNTYFGFSGADTYTVVTGGTTAFTIDSSQIPTFRNGTASGTAMYIHNFTDAVANTKTLIDFRVQGSDNSPFYVAGQMGSKAEGTWTSTSSTRDASLIFNTVLNGNNELALTLASDKTATFAGDISLTGGANIQTTGTDTSMLIGTSASGTSGVLTLKSTGTIKFNQYGSAWADTFTVTGAGNATFAGNLTIPEYIYHTGDTDTHVRFETNAVSVVGGGQAGLYIESAGNTVLQPAYDDDSVEHKIVLGRMAGSNSGSSSNDNPRHSTVLAGYSVDWSGGTRLSNEGFLMWHSGGGWSSNQRHFALTNAYNIGGSGGSRFALLLGTASTVEPTLGADGALGTNTHLAVSWDNNKHMYQEGNATFAGDVTITGHENTINIGAGGGVGTFTTSDANDYPRITTPGASAQLGLFRSGSAVGGVYIGADSGGFDIRNDSFATLFQVDMSGNVQLDGLIDSDGTGTNSFAGDIALAATKKLYLDGGSNTYIYESAGDDIDIVAGGNTSIAIRGINTIFGGYVHLNGIVNATGTGGEIGRNHAYDTLELKGYGAELMIGGQHTALHINYRTCNNGTSNHTPTDWYWRAGASNNWSNHNFGNVVVNGTLTFQPDADSQLWIGNVGTNATGIYGGSGDTVYIGGNNTWQMYLATNDYVYIKSWMNFAAGQYGIFSTTNSAHFFPENTNSYGVWRVNGDRNNYTGISFGSGGAAVTGMFDSGGNGGDYNSTSGWHFYYHRSNDCLAVADSTTSSSYGLYVTGAIYSTADVVAYSDKRAKENIVTVDNALDKVSELRGVYYNKKDSDDDKRQVGVIAQEVKEVLPEVVTYDKENDKYGVDYGKINGLLIEAIKDLKKEIEELKQCKKCTDCDCNN